MSMIWGEIAEMFMSGAGNSADAAQEKWQHLNNAHRTLCATLDLPELHVPDAQVSAVQNQDWIDSPADIRSIDWIVHVETGRKLDPEPGGMRGRARFIEDGEVRPPLGQPSFYVAKGNKLFFRDTPSDATTTLLVSFWAHPDNVGDANLDEYPLVTAPYDMTLLKLALGNFFDIHPPVAPDGTVDYARAQVLLDKASGELAGIRSRTTDENLDRRQFQQQPGYNFSLWGR